MKTLITILVLAYMFASCAGPKACIPNHDGAKASMKKEYKKFSKQCKKETVMASVTLERVLSMLPTPQIEEFKGATSELRELHRVSYRNKTIVLVDKNAMMHYKKLSRELTNTIIKIINRQ